VKVIASGISDLGLQREGNEDTYSIDESLGLYIVADGMGGHLAGEVASQVAVEMIKRGFRRWTEGDVPEDEIFGIPDKSLSVQGNYLLSSIRLANRVVYEMAVEYEPYHGMGTTVVALLATPKLLVVANVGDSRIYMIRDGRIERMSKDHTIVAEQIEMGALTEAEASSSPLKHILTKNLGSADDVDPEVFELEPSYNDRFILCTDGLTDLVREKEILAVAQKSDNPEAICRKLVDMALRRGAPDNTTVVSIFLKDVEKPRSRLMRKVGLFLGGMLTRAQKRDRKPVFLERVGRSWQD
jgi:serine/threonine protein phosphatase PrpC